MEQTYEQHVITQIFTVQHKFDNILEEMLSNIYNLYDLDGDGNLDFDDYVSFISDLMYISILMKRIKSHQYNVDNVLKIARWTASNISNDLFHGIQQLLPYDIFLKKMIYALTEYNVTPISGNDMHFSSLLPEFMNFFNYYTQLSHRRGWPSILNISGNVTETSQEQTIISNNDINSPEVLPEVNNNLEQEQTIIETIIPSHVPIPIPPEILDTSVPMPDIISIDQFDDSNNQNNTNQMVVPEEQYEMENIDNIIIHMNEKGYDMIEGDLYILDYINENKSENITFKVGDNYYLTNKTIIRSMINIGEKDNAIFFGCQCEIKDDWTRPETWARLQDVVVTNPVYFNIQHIGLPIRYVLLKAIECALNSGFNYFLIKKPENPVYIPSFASDNILNHGIGSMSGVHCQDGQRDIIYTIKSFNPKFTMN
jgi:hypothetical protein